MVNSDQLFDTLFNGDADVVTITPVVAPPATRLDSLRGPELTAALKRMSTKQLLVEWRNRSDHGVAAGIDRQQLIINISYAIAPDEFIDKDAAKKLVKQLNVALTVANDPTGVKREAAALARQTQFSLAGQVGAQGTKERRAELAAKTGETVSTKYTDDEVRTIRWMCANGWKDEAVADHFGNRTKPAMIWAIRKGVSYKSVDGQASEGPAAPPKTVKTTKPSEFNRR